MSGQTISFKPTDIQPVSFRADDIVPRVQPGVTGGKPYSAEEFMTPTTPQGSAAGRFVSNAADVLNPLQILEALNSLLHNPIDAIKNVGMAQADQASQALQFASQGDVGRAQGHALAAMVPVIGPTAADAGEQIRSGDIAGGMGRATALAAPIAVEGAIRGAVGARNLVPGSVRTAAANALDAGAAARVEDVMAPKVGANKVRFGNQAAKVAPDLAKDPSMSAFSREGLHGNVKAALERSKQELDHASDTRLASQQVDTAPILAKLDEQIARLTATPAEGSQPVRQTTTRTSAIVDERGKPIEVTEQRRQPIGSRVEPSPNGDQIATLRQIRDEVASLGARAPYESVRRIREAWDQPAKVKYMPSTSADALKGQGQATAASKGTGAIRDALASVDTTTAAANAKYSLYKSADDVLEAAKETERTRPKVGRQIMARLTGSVVGGEAAGATGAVAGYVLGPIADAAAGAGFTTKLKTAQIMSQLAGVIRSGDVAAVDALIGKLKGLMPQKTTLASRATSPSESQKQTAPGLVPQGIR